MEGKTRKAYDVNARNIQIFLSLHANRCKKADVSEGAGGGGVGVGDTGRGVHRLSGKGNAVERGEAGAESIGIVEAYAQSHRA